jgi:hypothetical protein
MALTHWPLGVEIAKAVGLDVNTIQRIVFTADTREGPEQIEVTFFPHATAAEPITKRYELKEVADVGQ